MLIMHGRTTSKLSGSLRNDLWRVCGPEAEPSDDLACVYRDDPPPAGFGLYLSAEGPHAPAPAIVLPRQLDHLSPGDVIHVSPDGGRLTILWKASARHNSLLLTEQCDNYCIMCSQPPKERADAWLFDRAERIVALIPDDACAVTLTGGEPALNGDRLLALLHRFHMLRPHMAVHLLSNGRRFADPEFSRSYAEVQHPGLMVGIPLYAAEASLHDFIVQAPGAFVQTVRGILNLAALGQRVEIRIVVQRHNVDHLPLLAEYICRNLPFVDQVALMGLEMTGLARANATEVWVDPAEYTSQLASAATRLDLAGITTKIYNHQLCTLDRRVWRLAVRSISDWKNGYAEPCGTCELRDLCGGVFTTSRGRVSAYLRPITLQAVAPAPPGPAGG